MPRAPVSCPEGDEQHHLLHRLDVVRVELPELLPVLVGATHQQPVPQTRQDRYGDHEREQEQPCDRVGHRDRDDDGGRRDRGDDDLGHVAGEEDLQSLHPVDEQRLQPTRTLGRGVLGPQCEQSRHEQLPQPHLHLGADAEGTLLPHPQQGRPGGLGDGECGQRPPQLTGGAPVQQHRRQGACHEQAPRHRGADQQQADADADADGAGDVAREREELTPEMHQRLLLHMTIASNNAAIHPGPLTAGTAPRRSARPGDGAGLRSSAMMQ